MFKKRRKEPKLIDNSPEYRPFSMVVMLICGIVISAIGAYLYLSNSNARGPNLPDKYGNGGGGILTLSGTSTIIIGFVILSFPAFILFKQKLKSGKNKKNKN